MNSKKAKQLRKLAWHLKQQNSKKDYKKIYKKVKKDYKLGIFKI